MGRPRKEIEELSAGGILSRLAEGTLTRGELTIEELEQIRMVQRKQQRSSRARHPKLLCACDGLVRKGQKCRGCGKRSAL